MFGEKEIVVKTQKEFDKIKLDFEGKIIIDGNITEINKNFNDARIIVYGNATIESVYDNATIKSVYGNATIKYVYDNATIESVYYDATIKSVSGNATIESVYGNATILLMTGLASIVLLYSAKKIIAKGFNLIRQIGTEKINIQKGKNVNYIQIKKTLSNTPSFEMFKKMYPVKLNSKKSILYKAVHKRDKKYFSEYNSSFEYQIGEIKKHKIDKQKENSCSTGLHVSHKIWAVNFGINWDDMALLECEVPINKIIVAKDCDGKVRTSELKVLREVPKEEYYN
jgi:hypothetical protein